MVTARAVNQPGAGRAGKSPRPRGRPVDPQKRAGILAVATQVFLTQGYRAASMDLIARRAGVSKVTIYAHFSSKTALFGAIIDQLAGQLTNAIQQLALDDLPPEQALQEVGRAYLGLALAPGSLALHRLVVAESARNPALGRLIFRSGPKTIIETLADYLAGQPRLKLSDPVIAAEQFLGMVLGHQQLGLLLADRRPSDIERLTQDRVSQAVQLFLHGCGSGASGRN